MADVTEQLETCRVIERGPIATACTGAFFIGQGRGMVHLESGAVLAREGEEALLLAAAVGGDGAVGEVGTADRDHAVEHQGVDEANAEAGPGGRVASLVRTAATLLHLEGAGLAATSGD